MPQPAVQSLRADRARTRVKRHQMKFAVCLLFVVTSTGSLPALAAVEQCRFIEARAEREACYQRQEIERAIRQKAQAAREAEQPKPAEPMTSEDATLARAMRGICRGC